MASSTSTDTITRPKIKTEDQIQEPPLYKVILLNDDITTMEFVVNLLCTIFHKHPDEAYQIMMKVHKTGKGLCGIYVKDIAKVKVERVHRAAAMAGFPLKCVMEKD